MTIQELAAAIMQQVGFAEHSDDQGARNALREIARLCRQALDQHGGAGDGSAP
ncbi:MAG TPA: hypothetical protein VKF59_10890 [Candidatus Dormibacteraeota bacterium]|nr:hypothetical protein [Candidatus Dormibacteraeota bacterium]